MVKHILGSLSCDCFCCQSKSLAIEEGQKNTTKAMGRGMLKTGVSIPIGYSGLPLHLRVLLNLSFLFMPSSGEL